MTKVRAQKSAAHSFEGWNLIDFLKGRKKLIIQVIGGIAGWIATQDPTLAVVSAAGADLLVALIEYWTKKY